MSGDNVSSFLDALAQRNRTAAAMNVELVEGPAGGWQWRDGSIAHERTDFFRVIGRRVNGTDHIMMRQSEHALVGLLVCGPPEARRVLLNTRAEPGLHGLCQFSTTVQSTPSNYERRHGGAATPHLEYFLTPAPGAVLHDSLQWDWGDYYHLKSKRMLIVEVSELFDVDEPTLWLDMSDARRLARMPHMVTSDLRVALATLSALDRGVRAVAPHSLSATLTGDNEPVSDSMPCDVSLLDSPACTVHPRGIHGQRLDVVWARTTTTTREVSDWVQPLLAPDDPLALSLIVRRGERGFEAAVTVRSALGLDGRSLVYPALAGGGTTLANESSSAEGGRFWRHGVDMRVVEHDDGQQGSSAVTWLPLSHLDALALEPLRTSLELRLLLELASTLERDDA